MRFSCERCGKRYATNDTPLPGRIYRIKCKACGNLIEVKGSAAGGSPGGASPTHAIPDADEPVAAPPPLPPPAESKYIELFDDKDFTEPPPAPTPVPAPPPAATSAPPPAAAEPPLPTSALDERPSPFAASFAPPLESFPPSPTAAPPVPAYTPETTSEREVRDAVLGMSPLADDPLASMRSELEAHGGAGELAEPPAAEPPPRAKEPQRPKEKPALRPVPPRRRSPLVGVVGAAVAIAAVGAGVWWFRTQPTGSPPAAAAPSRPSLPAPSPAPTTAQPAPAPATQPPATSGVADAASGTPAAEPPATATEPASPAPTADAAPAPPPEPKRAAAEQAPPRAAPARAAEKRLAKQPEKPDKKVAKAEPRRTTPVPARAEPASGAEPSPAPPPEPAPKDAEAAPASAGLAQDDIQRVLNGARKSFDACLRDPSRGLDQPLGARQVSLRFTIEPEGTVSYPTLDDVTISSAPVGQCLKAAARGLMFPPFRGDPVKVDHPVAIPGK